jgi:plasmid maintenance system killer protein
MAMAKTKQRELMNENGLVKIITLPRFKRMTQRHPREPILRALRNIGTGKGHEEQLRGERKGQSSIRVDSGERIIFKYNPRKTEAYVFGYTSSHDYKNA